MIKSFISEASLRRLCLLNSWPNSTAWEEESICRQVYYRVKNFHSLWRTEDLSTTELPGHMFSCLKLSGDSLFTGMINGDIREFNLRSTIANQSEGSRILQVEWTVQHGPDVRE